MTENVRPRLTAGIDELYQLTMKTAGAVEKMLHDSVRSLKNRDQSLAHRVIDADANVNDLALQIETTGELLIARHHPVSSDLRRILCALRVGIDLERIGDLSSNIARVTVDLGDEPFIKPLIDIPRMAAVAQEMVRDSLTALIREDRAQAGEVYLRDELLDELYWQIFRELLSFVIEDPSTTGRAIPLLFVARHLERVGDHATNICEGVYYLTAGERRIEDPTYEGGRQDEG